MSNRYPPPHSYTAAYEYEVMSAAEKRAARLADGAALDRALANPGKRPALAYAIPHKGSRRVSRET